MNGQSQTFAPPGRPLVKALIERLHPLLHAFRQFTQGMELEEVAERRRAEREPVRRQLLAFEREVTQLRKAVAERHVHPHTLRPDLLEWMQYDRAAFYIQLRLLYARRGFWDDADRVEQLGQKGVKYTSTVKDEHGTPIGSETVTDNGRTSVRGNAVEVEFG